MTNLVAEVESVVRERPGASAISVADNDTTYAQFWALTGRFAGALRERGFEPGTAVALYLPNLPQFVVAFYGVLRAGGTVVPLDPSLQASEIREPLADSDAVATVTTLDRVPAVEAVHDHTLLRYVVTADGSGQYSTGFSEFLAEGADALDYWEVADRDDDDVAVLAQTAGTTGEPAVVELAHGNLTAGADAVSQLLPNGLSADDATFGALPFWHAYGLTAAMHATLASGATLYPMGEWDAGEALALLDAEITVFHGLPSTYEDLLAHPDSGDSDLSSVELAGVVGAPSPETRQRFDEEFDVTLHEGYGLTETAGLSHANAPNWGRREGSVGKPVPGVFARVVDDGFEDVPPAEEGPVEDHDEVTGEIVVAGPTVATGYHGRPDATDDSVTNYDGRRWFHTGDVGYRDEDDYYYVVDRQVDVVTVDDRIVYASDVADRLSDHDAVAEVAVVGVEREDGRELAAYVVTESGADATVEELLEFCGDSHARPHAVEFVDALPRTTTGTVRRTELPDPDWEAAPDVVGETVGDEAEDADQEREDEIDDGEVDAEPEEDDVNGKTEAPEADAEETEDAEEAVAEGEDDAEGEVDVGEDGAEEEVAEGEDGEVEGEGETAGDELADEEADDLDAVAEAATVEAGTAPEAGDDGGSEDGATSLKDLKGISESRAATLRDAGFESVSDLRSADRDSLTDVKGFGDALVDSIKEQVDEED